MTLTSSHSFEDLTWLFYVKFNPHKMHLKSYFTASPPPPMKWEIASRFMGERVQKKKILIVIVFNGKII